MDIRIATIDDAEGIRRIYEPYVRNTAVSFEYEVPTVEEFRSRISNTLINYPYVVATMDGEVIGYAYAGQFHTREAYKHAAELSIYVDMNHRKSGIGSSLYNEIIRILKRQNIYTVHACIASEEVSDEYLTDDSRLFHSKMGFNVVGRHNKCGYKFGRWYSIIWMDKDIQEKPEVPEAFVPFSMLEK